MFGDCNGSSLDSLVLLRLSDDVTFGKFVGVQKDVAYKMISIRVFLRGLQIKVMAMPIAVCSPTVSVYQSFCVTVLSSRCGTMRRGTLSAH